MPSVGRCGSIGAASSIGIGVGGVRASDGGNPKSRRRFGLAKHRPDESGPRPVESLSTETTIRRSVKDEGSTSAGCVVVGSCRPCDGARQSLSDTGGEV